MGIVQTVLQKVQKIMLLLRGQLQRLEVVGEVILGFRLGRLAIHLVLDDLRQGVECAAVSVESAVLEVVELRRLEGVLVPLLSGEATAPE